MESRVHNVIDLRSSGDIAMIQLRRSIDCAREWSRYLLSSNELGPRKRVRAVTRSKRADLYEVDPQPRVSCAGPEVRDRAVRGGLG